MPDPDAVREAAGGWLQSARGDLVAASALLAAKDIDPAIVAFHAQQAAEKALKALLVLAGVGFARTHDLAHLAPAVASTTPSVGGRLPSDEALEWLTQIGQRSRCPDYGALAGPDRDQAGRAVALASEVVAIAGQVVDAE